MPKVRFAAQGKFAYRSIVNDIFNNIAKFSYLCKNISMNFFTELNKRAAEVSNGSDMLDDSHFFDFRSNIYNSNMEERFLRMFMSGNGGELKCKAAAAHSSSMLGYNFFHWISERTPLTFKNVTYTKVYFEVKLPTLKGTTAANMDLVLKGCDKERNSVLLFIENKFTEYFTRSKSELTKMEGSTYFNDDKYYIKQEADRWMEIIKYFSNKANAHGNEGYYNGIKQAICHLIALSNLKNSEYARLVYKQKYADCRQSVEHPEINGAEIFLFKSLVFRPRKDFGYQDAFMAYKALYDELMQKIQKIDSLRFLPEHESVLSLGDLWPSIKSSIKDTNLIDYLEEKYICCTEAFKDCTHFEKIKHIPNFGAE